MPKDNSALCQILILDNTVEWSNKKNQFVILFRIHHSLGDGFSLITLLLRHLVDSRQKLETYVDLWTRSQPKKKWFAYLWTVLFGQAVVVLHHLFRPVDKNYLHRRKLCGEKIIAWAAEKEEKLVPLVKMIKNKSPGTRFSDVVLAAVSASLAEFLHTKNHSDTNFVTCVIPTLLNFKCTTSLENPKNNFSVAELRLPLHSDNILDTLQDVRTATQALRHSPDYLVHFWLLRTLAPVLPEPFLNLLIYSRHSTMAISILPGTGKLMKGHSLDDMIFWIPHRGSTGVGLSVLSYDNRFQIGLTVDKALLVEQKDAQAIVDGVFKYILKLHQNISAIV
ncbi:uncharacterized protein [Tenebrio molitor]|uniref:uncharacterized protein n=1 Tax=Tenebrio molitor TaxID=7067 RepID=UPI0036249D7D